MPSGYEKSDDYAGKPVVIWRWVVAAIVLIAALAFATYLRAEPIDRGRIRVIDGDTIRVDHAKPDVRLVPFNAPETRRAACEGEKELGGRATRRLRDLVHAGDLDLDFVACSCRPGTEGTDKCNHGRKCGVLKAGGKNVGDILTAEGLATPYQCGQTSCPKLPRPWCDSRG